MKIIIAILKELIEWILSSIPTLMGIAARRCFYGISLKKTGKSLQIHTNVEFTNLKNISLGNNVVISKNCMLYAHSNGQIIIGNNVSIGANVIINATEDGKITIDDNTIIAPNVYLRASNHHYIKQDTLIRKQGHNPGIIHIEEDVWCAAGVTILPNVKIKKGSVLGAGAVITKDTQTYGVYTGIPATLNKKRF